MGEVFETEVEDPIPELVLNQDFVMNLLFDPDFYAEAPEFYFMKQGGVKAADFFRRRQAGDETCETCNPDQIIRKATTVFAQHLLGLANDCPATALDNFVNAVTKRVGYRPAPIVLQHKRAGKPDTEVGRLEI